MMLVVRAITQGRDGLSGILLSAHGWFVAEAAHLAIRAAGAWHGTVITAAQQYAEPSRLESSNVGSPQLKNTIPPAQFLSQQGLTTSSCPQAGQAGRNWTVSFAASQVDREEYEVRRQLMRLGLPRSVAEQAIQQAQDARQPYQQLPAHMQTLLKLAGPDTAHQRRSFVRSLPALLQSTPEALTDAAVQLTKSLRHLGIPGQAVQQFVRQQSLVLQEEPQFIAAQLAGWAKMLGSEPADVLTRIWCADSESPLYQQPLRRMQLRVNGIKNSFQLNNKDVAQMLELWPDVLLFGPGELRERLTAVWDRLKPYGWTRERLTPALVQQPRLLARDVKQIQGVWDAVQAYAAVHPPSQQQLQTVAGLSEILAVFQSPERNMLLIQYVTMGMQRKVQPQEDVWQAPTVGTSCGGTSAASGDLLSDTSPNNGDNSASGEDRLQASGAAERAKDSTTVWQIISMRPMELEQFVNRRFPRFWRYEQQQQQVRQQAERQQHLRDQRKRQLIDRRLRDPDQWHRRGTWRRA